LNKAALDTRYRKLHISRPLNLDDVKNLPDNDADELFDVLIGDKARCINRQIQLGQQDEAYAEIAKVCLEYLFQIGATTKERTTFRGTMPTTKETRMAAKQVFDNDYIGAGDHTIHRLVSLKRKLWEFGVRMVIAANNIEKHRDPDSTWAQETVSLWGKVLDLQQQCGLEFQTEDLGNRAVTDANIKVVEKEIQSRQRALAYDRLRSRGKSLQDSNGAVWRALRKPCAPATAALEREDGNLTFASGGAP